MKIIQKGRLPKDRVWRGTCSNCRAVVEALESELTGIQGDQRDGPFSREECPECHTPQLVFHPVKTRGLSPSDYKD